MTPNLLKIFWISLPVLWGMNELLVCPEGQPLRNGASLVLFVVFIAGWAYLGTRIFGFRKRLFHFLRRLLANDYEAGIRTHPRVSDEISELERLANKLSDQLRTYDRLRADRVSIHARALDLVLLCAKDALISANIEKNTFTFNPAAQKRLGITRKNFSFESVLKPKSNLSFQLLFEKAVHGRKVNTEGHCQLQLPGMNTPHPVDLFLMPLRDRDENVRFALLSLNPEKIDLPVTPERDEPQPGENSTGPSFSLPL